MSSSDSFINEVTEEVRRDRLFTLMRRWGWVAVLLVLVLVGGAAWTEWSRARERAQAQAFGDALLTALAGDDMAARRAALADVVPQDGEQAAVLSLIRAATLRGGAGADPEAARDELLALSEMTDLDPTYRHLAVLKAILAGGTGDAARDAALLEELAAPGAPYRTLAVEQQALAALDADDEAAALTLLRQLTEDADASQALRRRATQLIVALGASPEPA